MPSFLKMRTSTGSALTLASFSLHPDESNLMQFHALNHKVQDNKPSLGRLGVHSSAKVGPAGDNNALSSPGQWPVKAAVPDQKDGMKAAAQVKERVKTPEPDLQQGKTAAQVQEQVKAPEPDLEQGKTAEVKASVAKDQNVTGWWQTLKNFFSLDIIGMDNGTLDWDTSEVDVNPEHSGETKFLGVHEKHDIFDLFLYNNDPVLRTLDSLGFNKNDFLITMDLSDPFAHHIIVSHRKLLNAELELDEWVDPLSPHPEGKRIVQSTAMHGESRFRSDEAISCDGKYYPANKDNFLVDVIARRSSENLPLSKLKSFNALVEMSDPVETQSRALQCMKTTFPADGIDVTVIDWIAMQNPLASWDLTRPPLPGQHHPSLGIALVVGKIMTTLAYKNGRDGLMNQPEEFHLAYKYNEAGYRFIDPHHQGWFKALAHALQGNIEIHGLSAVSWCVHNECVENDKLNSPQRLFGVEQPSDREWFVQWQLQDQILPLSDKMKAYFNGKEYNDIVDAVYKEHATDKFWIDWELNGDAIKLRQYSKKYLRKDQD